MDAGKPDPAEKLSGKEIRKGTGDVLKDIDYALRFVDGDGIAGVLGLELDFVNRALRVAKGQIVQLRQQIENAPWKASYQQAMQEVAALREAKAAAERSLEEARLERDVLQESTLRLAEAGREHAKAREAAESQLSALRGALPELIRRARLYKKVGPAGSGIKMHQLIAVEVEFSLSKEQLQQELTLLLAVQGTGWTATPDNINALPAPIRAYIHDLETRCDPAGELRELVIARDTIQALQRQLEERQASSSSSDRTQG